jgi:carboxylesterase type B
MIGSENFANGSPGIFRPSSRYARGKSVVFVRPNFRLNAFGFLSLESISNSSKVPSSGNYALTDIIAALDWINTNIHNFGGDRNSVTLFGHRTGATLVTALTASPKAAKLFKNVWASSGSAHYPGSSFSLSDYERKNLDFQNFFPEAKSRDDWKRVDAKAILEKLPESWSKEHANLLPGRDENMNNFHDWLVTDGKQNKFLF